jgi:hypothetical protein
VIGKKKMSVTSEKALSAPLFSQHVSQAYCVRGLVGQNVGDILLRLVKLFFYSVYSLLYRLQVLFDRL